MHIKKIYISFYILFSLPCTQLTASEKSLITTPHNNNSSLNFMLDTKETPLILAIQQNNENLVESLLEKGANPNAEDSLGNYPIHIAMEWDTERESQFYKKRKILPNIVTLLLKYGANPNARYLFKNATPLHAAVFHNNPIIVQTLLHHGATKKLCDSRDLTPLDLAKQYQYKEIITILSNNTNTTLFHSCAPPALNTVEEEIELFHVIEEIKKTPLIINTRQPFSSKTIIDDYLPISSESHQS